MPEKKNMIETGVDKLIRLISEMKKISVKQAAKELGFSISSIQEWADFLEDEGLISIESHLAKVYLIERKISKSELLEKVRDVREEKEQVSRKVESSINVLTRDKDELKIIESEFKDLQGMMDRNFSNLSKKVKSLEDFRNTHRSIEVQRRKIDNAYEKRMKNLDAQLKREMAEYDKAAKLVSAKIEKVNKENENIEHLKNTEKVLREQVMEINTKLNKLKDAVNNSNDLLKDDEIRLSKAQDNAKKIKGEIESGGRELALVAEQAKRSHKELEESEREIIKEVEFLEKGDLKKVKSYTESKEFLEKFKKFFDQAKDIKRLIYEAEKEDVDLKKRFDRFAKKVAVFKAIASTPAVKKELVNLKEELEHLTSRKSVLDSRLHKLRSVFKSLR